jgi:hypothetical protein
LKQQASTSFLKKSSKKLLDAGGCGTAGGESRNEQKFFAAFFQKRSSCFTGLS